MASVESFFLFVVFLCFLNNAGAIAQQVCAGATQATVCNFNSTCCTQQWSVTGKGCCPLGSDAVCCANGYTCCPAGTVCVDEGSSWSVVTTCKDPAGETVQTGLQVCKPGSAYQFNTSIPGLLVIGDSVSIGYTPFIQNYFGDKVDVQHSPYDVSDGGAEETAYGAQCIDFFLQDAAGQNITPNVIMFNWGIHNIGNETVPGQAGNMSSYLPYLEMIVQRLKQTSSKLVFALTSPMMCDVPSDDNVITLNQEASELMAQYDIPTIDVYAAVVAKCGPVPQSNCFPPENACPHYNPQGYQWLAESVFGPPLTQLLSL